MKLSNVHCIGLLLVCIIIRSPCRSLYRSLIYSVLYLRFIIYSQTFNNFLSESMLQVNPNDRPTINDIIDRIKEIAVAQNVNLKGTLHIAENIPANLGTFLLFRWTKSFSISSRSVIHYFYSLCSNWQCRNQSPTKFGILWWRRRKNWELGIIIRARSKHILNIQLPEGWSRKSNEKYQRCFSKSHGNCVCVCVYSLFLKLQQMYWKFSQSFLSKIMSKIDIS